MIINADAIQWAKEYEGALFHALICDPPYHLTTITDRFGKKDPASLKEGSPYKSFATGFMGKVWDGGDIAFQPETWKAFYNILYPGAFGMAFGGSRTAHRMAVAIEDAGFIIHPQMSWCYGSGFPKATRIDTQIQPKEEMEKEQISKPGIKTGASNYKDNKAWSGEKPIATEESAKQWEGHRYGLQALKPASEPIIVFQKPYEGRPVDSITETGAGALNIDQSRIGGEPWKWGTQTDIKGGGYGNKRPSEGDVLAKNVTGGQNGRWPSNFVLTHSADCQMIGYRDSDSYQINRFKDGAKPFGDGAGHEFESEEVEGGRVPVWECVDGCPVKALDKQSGRLTSGTGAVKKATSAGHQGNVYSSDSRPFGTPNIEYGDSGGASRFFHQSHWAIENADPFVYQAKVSVSERNAGLKGFDAKKVLIGAAGHKPNPMPESVTDRPTKSHEYIFLLTKKKNYYYDADSIREESKPETVERYKSPLHIYGNKDGGDDRNDFGRDLKGELNPAGRNKRTVWTITPKPYKGAHFATFPPEIPEICIKAGTSEKGVCPVCGSQWERIVSKPIGGLTDKSWNDVENREVEGNRIFGGQKEYESYQHGKMLGWKPTCSHDEEPVPATVLDNFGGSGTTAMVANQLGRHGISLDLSWEYLQLAKKRTGITALKEWESGRKAETNLEGLPMFEVMENHG